MSWQPFGWDLDWGNVPAGLGTVLTSASVLIASLAYRRSVLNAETSQADKVAAWFEDQDSEVLEKAVVFIRNASELPVYMTELYIGMGSSRKHAKRYFVGTIQPETTKTVQTNELMSSAIPPTEIAFQDVRGVSWRRTEHGNLHRQVNSRLRNVFKIVGGYISYPSTLKALVPQRYEIDENVDASPEWRLQAIAAAEDLLDASPRQAKRAIDRFLAHKRLTFNQYVIANRAARFADHYAPENPYFNR